jgi:mannosylglycerate hydrolase
VAEGKKTIYIVPHTHWDREWYETFETFRGQLVELWDELLSLTESDPDFRFLMDGQTVVIDDYLEVRPQNRERLEAAVRRGQIQVGPWYTLPDEFLVSGETLVRNLQRGLRSAAKHGGSMMVGYLPDSFGHAAQMPQLYRQLGFRYAAVWRGVPLSIDRVAFLWEAPDGSEILTAYMGNSYSHGVDLPTEAQALGTRLAAALAAIEPFGPTSDILLMNGNDHVLPQRSLSAAVRAASELDSGTAVKLARLDDYLGRLPDKPWPRWRGELRSSARANVLMGTLSVRVTDKQVHAQATRTLERLAEPLVALTRCGAGEQLEAAWTNVLQNAAHDTACGSGIDAVAQASRRRSLAALATARNVVDSCLGLMAGEDQVWNPSAFPRQGVVEVSGEARLIAPLPGLSVGALAAVEPKCPVRVGATWLENGVLRAELRTDGTIDVLHKPTAMRYQGLHRLVDEGDAGDEYNFSPVAERPFQKQVRDLDYRVLEQHLARGRIEARFRYVTNSGLSSDRRARAEEQVVLPVLLRLSLEADSDRLDLEVELENRGRDHRLRAHFPLPFAPSSSAADTPFHVTRRPVIGPRRDPGAPEVEMPTYPMWSFVDVSDGSTGLALISDGLHEYEVLPPPANQLAVTLLRAVGWLSRDDLATRTGHAGPAMQTPGAQVLGRHHFRYSLFFHRGDWEQGTVWRAAEAALLPLQSGRGKGPEGEQPSVELEPDSLQMTACVPREGGFDLRVLNASERPADGIVRLRPEPAGAAWLTLAGEDIEPGKWGSDGLEVSLRPWQIATLRVRR